MPHWIASSKASATFRPEVCLLTIAAESTTVLAKYRPTPQLTMSTQIMTGTGQSANGSVKPALPVDQRVRQGGWLFLLSLLVFFVSSILLFGIYAYSRRDDPQSQVPLPAAFLVSTICLVAISFLVHLATRAVRRDRFRHTAWLLGISTIAAIVFTVVQCLAMIKMLLGPAMFSGTGKGVAGMVVVLAILHALHVLGGIIALGIVTVRSSMGRYDHERHWPVDFAAQYWHFLDLVWLCMIFTFWMTTGGFAV